MIVFQRYSFSKNVVSVIFPHDYDTTVLLNFFSTRNQKMYTVTSIGGDRWIDNNKQLVDKYNLTKVLSPGVNLEDVLEYCRIFDEEVVYAKDYHSK